MQWKRHAYSVPLETQEGEWPFGRLYHLWQAKGTKRGEVEVPTVSRMWGCI
jgi:hypothetical protein